MKIHIVKIGETLYGLAKKYGIELAKLIALNPQIVNPGEIQAGQKVRIPGTPKPMEPAEGTYTFKHVVKQGDSLWKLSKAWDVPLAALIAANPQLKNPNVLLTGEIVYIPKKGTEAPAPTPVPTPPATLPAENAVPEEIMFSSPHFDALAEHVYGETPHGSMMPQWPPQIETQAAEAGAAQQYQFEPLYQQQPPMLSEPFAGVQGVEPPAVNPFAQTNIPATEAFAQGQMQQYSHFPQFPQMPSEPFEHYMQAYAGYPHHAGYPSAPMMPAYDMPMTAYPFAHTGDCGCYGPKLDMPGAFGPGMLPYAAPLGMPFAPAAPQYEGMPFQEMPYGELPHYPQLHPQDPAHWAGLKLEETEKETDIDIALDDDKRVSASKAGVSGKKSKSPRSQLESYLNSVRHRSSDRKQHRPNTPWINV